MNIVKGRWTGEGRKLRLKNVHSEGGYKPSYPEEEIIVRVGHLKYVFCKWISFK